MCAGMRGKITDFFFVNIINQKNFFDQISLYLVETIVFLAVIISLTFHHCNMFDFLSSSGSGVISMMTTM